MTAKEGDTNWVSMALIGAEWGFARRVATGASPCGAAMLMHPFLFASSP